MRCFSTLAVFIIFACHFSQTENARQFSRDGPSESLTGNENGHVIERRSVHSALPAHSAAAEEASVMMPLENSLLGEDSAFTIERTARSSHPHHGRHDYSKKNKRKNSNRQKGGKRHKKWSSSSSSSSSSESRETSKHSHSGNKHGLPNWRVGGRRRNTLKKFLLSFL